MPMPRTPWRAMLAHQDAVRAPYEQPLAGPPLPLPALAAPTRPAGCTLATTGPRSLAYLDTQDRLALAGTIRTTLARLAPERVITGGAPGWDELVHIEAVRLAIPVDLYLPWPSHRIESDDPDERHSARLLRSTADTVTVTSDRHHAAAFQARNEAMVLASQEMLAWAQPAHLVTRGGTAHAIRAARYHDRPVIWHSHRYAWPTDLAHVWDRVQTAAACLDQTAVPIGPSTRWRLPFTLGAYHAQARYRVVRQYARWLLDSDNARPLRRALADGALTHRTLACSCAPDLCHGLALAAMADDPTPTGAARLRAAFNLQEVPA